MAEDKESVSTKDVGSDKNTPEKKEEEEKTVKKEPPKIQIKILKNECSSNITEVVEGIVKKFDPTTKIRAMADALKRGLEKNFPKGWNVFVGGHFVGVCTYEEGYCIELTVGDYIIVAFKSYIPPK
ncbi:hypothetical protein TCON_2227 [Astathelohania contejeani]|uniref:Dynein light chain n=1 Tax=Astathelohania contejeani TaxID=164912 RepID=A0ABQ7HWQ4_9MICR|nr:hypothetical protein TCON_2227 [Thelohania contejeani]